VRKIRRKKLPRMQAEYCQPSETGVATFWSGCAVGLSVDALFLAIHLSSPHRPTRLLRLPELVLHCSD